MFFLIIFISGCTGYKEYRLIKQTTKKAFRENKQVGLIPTDSLFCNWIRFSVKKTIHPSWIVQVSNFKNDTLFVEERYSAKIHFIGKYYEGKKIGLWSGYYKNILIIQTTFIDIGNTVPAYLKSWDINGNSLSEITFDYW